MQYLIILFSDLAMYPAATELFLKVNIYQYFKNYMVSIGKKTWFALIYAETGAQHCLQTQPEKV